jgi:hypothetical protein
MWNSSLNFLPKSIFNFKKTCLANLKVSGELKALRSKPLKLKKQNAQNPTGKNDSRFCTTTNKIEAPLDQIKPKCT